MGEEVITTGVDELLDLLKYNSKMPLLEAAKKLKTSSDVVQAWVDFLVEENIVGIEYKFTTPYIYLNKPLDTNRLDSSSASDNKIDVSYFKKQFTDKALKSNIPKSEIDILWKNHLMQELELRKEYFFFEAQNRHLSNISELWQEYESLLISG
jgi:hypothetical protein